MHVSGIRSALCGHGIKREEKTVCIIYKLLRDSGRGERGDHYSKALSVKRGRDGQKRRMSRNRLPETDAHKPFIIQNSFLIMYI